MGVETTVRKWGNSMGVILPKSLLDSNHIGEKDKIIIEVVKESNLRKLFGKEKRIMSGQEFKDMVRQGWK